MVSVLPIVVFFVVITVAGINFSRKFFLLSVSPYFTNSTLLFLNSLKTRAAGKDLRTETTSKTTSFLLVIFWMKTISVHTFYVFKKSNFLWGTVKRIETKVIEITYLMCSLK